MIGNAIKCDECRKIDLMPELRGANYEYDIKWYKVTPPQLLKPNEPTRHYDICSLKCLQSLAEGYTSNA